MVQARKNNKTFKKTEEISATELEKLISIEFLKIT